MKMPPNGQSGLRHDDNRWLLVENKSLRDMYRAERERRWIAEQEFRLLEEKMERANETE